MPRAYLFKQTTFETMNARCKRPVTARSVGGTFSVSLMFFGVLLSVIAHLELAVGSNTTTSLGEFQFDIEPKDYIAVKDSGAAFDCTVRGTSSSVVEIDWLKDGAPVAYDNRRKKLQNGSLYIESIEHLRHHRPDEGEYKCVAKSLLQGTIVSRRAKLQVAYLDKAFTDEPRSVSVHLGDVMMFPCQIKGLPTPDVRWFKDEVELEGPTHSNYLIHFDNVLELRSVQFSDFGRYKCKALNKDRIKFSRTAHLTQDSDAATYQGVLPRFIMRPQDTVAVEGSTVVLHCGANGRDRNGARPRLEWLKDGATLDLVHSENHFTLEGQGSLRIDGVQGQDAGAYTCRAINLEDSVDVDVTLTVQVPPKFRYRPKSLSAHVNADVELQCDVSGSPKPRIEWLKNGEAVVLDDYVQTTEGRNLKILGLIKSDEGMYQCTATNEVGMIQAAAQLLVSATDNVVEDEEFSTPTSRLSSPATDLTAAYISSRFLTLSWQFANKDEESAKPLGYLIYWSEMDSARVRQLNTTAVETNVQDLRPSTTYNIRVVTYNEYGVNINGDQITVETTAEDSVPGSPSSLQAIPTSTTSIWVSWTAPPSLTDPVSHYKLYYYNANDGAVEYDTTVTQTEYTVTGLFKFNTYGFRVVAHNKNGPGVSSDEALCRTYSDIPALPPQNVSAEAVSSTSIAVNWEPPPEGSQNGIITGYKIRYRQKQRGERSGNTVTTDGNLRIWELTGLERGVEYMIRVHALTVNGSGPASGWASAETFLHDLDETSVPGQPTSLRVRPFTNSIAVSWTPPVEQDIMIRGYVLGYGIGIPDVYSQILDAKMRYHTIKMLRPSSEYVISLKAYNSVGEGVPIYETTVTREESTPEPLTPMMPPVALKAIVLSSTTILLTWSDTTMGRNQRVVDNRYYTIRYGTKVLTKYKMVNATDLNLHVEDLRPDTEYEFSVKVTKGNRQSTWSLSVFNRTKEAVPTTSPRDLTPVAMEGRSTIVTLNWQPPRHANGQISGYLLYYTTDATEPDNEWVVEEVRGERLSTMIRDLTPETTYYFKIRARNSVGQGPMSPTVIFRTPRMDGSGGGIIETPDDFGSLSRPPIRNNWSFGSLQNSGGSTESPGSGSGGMISSIILWIIIGCIGGVMIVTVIIVMAIFCCRRSSVAKRKMNKEKMVDPKTKFSQKDLNPPDLWSHETAELTNIDREYSEGNVDEFNEQLPGCRRYATNSMGGGRYKSVGSPCTVPVVTPGDRTQSYQGVAKVLPRDGDEISSTRTHSSSNSTPRVNAGDITQSNTVSSVKQPLLCNSGSLGRQTPTVISPTRPLPSKSSCLPLRTPDVTKVDLCPHPLTAKQGSTEELSAEMANLEGLMKDLTAITQEQFDC